MYLVRRPGFALAPYIEMLWCCEGYPAAHRRERVLPGARFQLIIDLAPRPAPALVVGICTRYTILDTASLQALIGVVFRPGGARLFFEPPADDFFNRDVSLGDIWGSASNTLRGRLLEAAGPAARLRVLETDLEQRLRRAELHSAVRHGLTEFGRHPHAAGVIGVAREAGLSRRRFAGLFREQVGLPPKLYCRLRRFQQVVRRIASGTPINWAQVSLDGGYYDQAHMAHDFREFSGVSPGAWQASERPFLNHAVVE